MPSLLRKQPRDDGEREPLLPRHNQDTALQAGLKDKLHTYQMLNAVSRGYMPSNEQLVAHLLHATEILRVVPSDLSHTGKELIRSLREHIKQLVTFFEAKNGSDQIQDFVWYITKARLSVDTEDLERSAQEIRPRADITTGKYWWLSCAKVHANLFASIFKPFKRGLFAAEQQRVPFLPR